MIPPNSIDADQMSRYGQRQDLSKSWPLTMETQFQKDIMSIRLAIRNGLSDTAMDSLCDVLEDMSERLDKLENK